jgi:hypothetical protein
VLKWNPDLALTSVDVVLRELPTMPRPELDVAQDDTGYSAEVTLERHLAISEFDAFTDACLHVPPIVRDEGEHRLRGLASVDEDALWLYVHAMGPGRFGPAQDAAARDLLADLWRVIHEAVAADD